MQPPPLNEKVLKDKRKKLKETLDRVLKMYVSTFCKFSLKIIGMINTFIAMSHISM